MDVWRRAVLLAVAGTFLVQAGWVLALPPFRGSDEFDHAYRAAGVVLGQWRLTEPVVGGRGERVDVPPELVAAAAGQCRSLPYTEDSSCAPIRGATGGPEGTVAVATAAGSYHPVYYWVVGTAGRWSDGAMSLYAMRAAAGTLCLLLLAAGFAALAAARRGVVVWLAALSALTPTFLYSSVVVAPNGVEMAAGFALWAILLSLFARGTRAPVTRRAEVVLVAAGVVSCLVLTTVRTLGPVWLLLIVLCVAGYAGPSVAAARVRGRAPLYVAATVLVGAATLGSVLWSRASGLATTQGEPVVDAVARADPGPTSWTLALDAHVWVAQSIAAVPYRNSFGPLIVYPMVLAALLALLALGVRRHRGRRRAVVLIACALSLLVPACLIALTLSTQGAGWQGRYALPFVAGVPLLAVWAVDRAPWRSRYAARPVAVALLLVLAAAQVLTATHLQHKELLRAVSRDDEHWVHGPTALTGVVVGLGCLLWALAVAQVEVAARKQRGGSDDAFVGRVRSGDG